MNTWEWTARCKQLGSEQMSRWLRVDSLAARPDPRQNLRGVQNFQGGAYMANPGSGHLTTARHRLKILKILRFNRKKEHFWGLIELTIN